ncbi:MAG: serine/threonine protein kinase [Planctomycetes bacterium]|nr:serine/threonine protein kinase [Planctomycetota bacterium]
MDPSRPVPSSLAAALRAGPLGARRIPGSTLGPYVVVSEVGRGGFGVVLRARRRDQPGVDVALKVLLDGAEAGAARERRFEREAELSRALRHPGIVPVRDAGRLDGLAFIAFEFVEGTTLSSVLEDAPLARRLDLLVKVARAVAYAHARGVVHRDLKPANVLVRAADGRPLVADFGLARDTALDSSLTRTGAMLGTPAYMAPEQVSAKPPSPATDVFALGVMLYEALTGDLPFRGDNVAMRYAAILTGRLEAPSERAPDAPRALDAVVRRALAARPEDRYPDAGAFADAIDAALGTSSRDDEADGPAPAAPPASAPPRRARRAAALGAGALALLALLSAAWVLRGRAAARQEAAAAAVSAHARDLAAALTGDGAAGDRAPPLVAALSAAAAGPDADAAPLLRARAEAHVALAAWHLVERRLPEAQAEVATARGLDPAASSLALAGALLLVEQGRPGEAIDALRAVGEPAPFPPDLVDEARARALAARGDRRAALAAVDGALDRARTGPRLMLRARLLLGEERAGEALLDHEAARGLGAPDEEDLGPALARAYLLRATRVLSASDALGPADAARALADARAALARLPADHERAAVQRLGAVALEAGFGLLERMAGERGLPLAPSAEAGRAAHGLLEAAAACDPARVVVPADYVRAVVALCQRDDCPPPVRFQAASWMLRARLPFDPLRDVDLRLADPAADLSGPWARLRQELQAARGDSTKALNAYRTFSHVTRGAPALLPVAWEAEEEALARWPAGAARYHVLLARAHTLLAMKRGPEARPVMDEAVALCRAFPPAQLADTLFWRAGLLLAEGAPALAHADLEEGAALYAGAGLPPWPNGWWALQAASVLLALGRHEDALAAVATGRTLAGPYPRAYDDLEAKIRAARGDR